MGGETTPQTTGSSYPLLMKKPVGQQISNIYTDRLRQFTDGGQYRHQSLVDKLYHSICEDDDYIKLSVYSPAGAQSRPTFKDATSHSFKSTKRGESFGPSWSTHWFKIKLTVPKSMLKGEHLIFQWDTGSEGMVWTEDGNPLQGLTGNGERTEWILPKDFLDGKEHTFYIEMACNGMFGNAPGGDSIQPPDPNKYFTLETARIVDVNMVARQLILRLLDHRRCRKGVPRRWLGETSSSAGLQQDHGYLHCW